MTGQLDTAVVFVTDCDTVCAVGMMTAASRFILRVQEVLDSGEFKQKDLSVGNSEGWISNILKARRGLRLNDAAEIAAAMGRPLSELVRETENTLYELDNLEARAIEAFRQLSKAEQEAFVTIVTLRHRPGATPLYGTERNRAPRLQQSVHGRRLVPSALSPQLQSLIADAAEKITTELGRQTADPSTKVTHAADHRRGTRGSTALKKR